ncbi:putative phage tail protein [Clostridium sp. MD294]|uniref:putative phage tail protein n=1 Tax=Clostridium sp. MD294 TaxID=97138 RepID=UPI0002C9E1D8|nr:putative phage tail protein [Clostridium sp. MD294]NDO45968.1 DUF2313 domain-containing protein [Clostridium sp. MD294]USF30374.1 hypothetical protein C820_001815 [Clostridium sp. MD294]
MKYTSEDIQQILTSKTAIDGLDYITPVYHKAKTALYIMEAMGVQGDLFVKWVNETIAQILPQTATWALDYWEEEYGLPIHPNISIEQRRQKILLAVRTRAPMNPKRLEQILMFLFSLEKVSVLERTAKNTFCVELYGQILEEQWKNVYQTIEKYKPAHLILEAKSILQLPMPEKTVYIGGTVFRPISETILSEMEYNYQFPITVHIGGVFQNILQTTLPELEFKTSAVMNVVADWCDIEQTTLSEM